MAKKSTFTRMREDERASRKELIVDVAVSLFEKDSFHEVGMRDIAKEVGISTASIYRYFSSRDELYVESLSRDMCKIETLLKERLGKGISSIDEMAIAVIDYLMDNEIAFQVMCHFMVRGPENTKSFDKFTVLSHRFLAIFEDVLDKAGIAGPVQLFPYALFASLAGVVMICRNDPNFGDKERRELMYRMARIMIEERSHV